MAMFDLFSFPHTERVEWFWIRLSIIRMFLDGEHGFTWEPESNDAETLKAFAEFEELDEPPAGISYVVKHAPNRVPKAKWSDAAESGMHHRFESETVLSVPCPTWALKNVISRIADFQHDESSGRMVGSFILTIGSTAIPLSIDVMPARFGDRIVFNICSSEDQNFDDAYSSAMSHVMAKVGKGYIDGVNRTASFTDEGIVYYSVRESNKRSDRTALANVILPCRIANHVHTWCEQALSRMTR